MTVRIAIPNKGRLQEPAIRLLEDAGIGVIDRAERQLFARTRDKQVDLVFVRTQDIPKLVEQGAADLGITGHDLVVESGARVKELLDLEFGSAKMVVAVSEKSRIKQLSDLGPSARVATEFPRITKDYFKKKRRRIKISRISGSAEITPLVGVADVIVDLVSTGATLRAHGLRVIDELMQTSARLIANPAALREKRAKIEQIKTALESVVRARGKKLILMNVPEEKLNAVKLVVPAMAGPTVSRVESAEPMLAIQAVVDAELVEEVVREARRAGARDILVVPIERVLP
jgi:ATP phosphoribosyltransferase